MSVRTFEARFTTIGLMMAAWMIPLSNAHGQEQFWNWGIRTMPWSTPSSSCSQGTCPPRNRVAPVWSPSPVIGVPVPGNFETNHGVARPTYRVNPGPAMQTEMSQSSPRRPSPNRGSPYYENSQESPPTAPARVISPRVIPPRVVPVQNVPPQVVPPQRPTAKSRTNSSPFYP